MVAKDNLSGGASSLNWTADRIIRYLNYLGDVHAVERAVITAAKDMRDQQPDSVRALYAAVDALRALERQT